MLKEASRLYAASWVRDIGPYFHPNDCKDDESDVNRANGGKIATKEKEPSVVEDLVEQFLSHIC